MNVDDISAAVTATAALFTAIGAAVANLGLLLSILRHARKTHTIVNQQRTDAAIYQAITTDALVQNGIPVPPDPSLSPTQATQNAGG